MRGMNEITQLSAQALSSLLRDGEVSCVELTQAFLARIDELNPRLNALCTVTHDAALAAAAQADAAMRSGAALGPLHGLPLAFKDLTPTAGIRTTRGSRLYEDHVPEADAPLVRRLRQAGAIVLGKTNTPEFGHKAVTENLLFGPTRNPWRLDRVAGGSSGGAAAAVAAGLLPFAEGSDGAGSIRIPASLCGVFGFKPSYGRVPDVAGGFSSHSPFLHNGPLARSVGDAALLYQAMAGADWRHPFSVAGDGNPLARLDHGIAGARVAFSPDLGYFPVDEQVAATCAQAARAFADLGCRVDEVALRLPDELESAFQTLWGLKLAGSYGDLPQPQADRLEPLVRRLIEQGRRVSADDYLRANRVRETVWNRLNAVFEGYDLLLSPTTAVAAFPIGGIAPESVRGRPVDPLLGWVLTYPFNLTGHPAASVPCGVSPDGLPIGLQVVGRRLEDDLVLRACRAFERLRPWPRLAQLA